jgi:hypothetical protein
MKHCQGTLAVADILLPASPALSDVVGISFLNLVTALAVQDSVGTLMATAPTNAYGLDAARRYVGGSINWVYWK